MHGLIELSDRSPGEIVFIRIMGQGQIAEGAFELSITDAPSDMSCGIQYIEVGKQSPCSLQTNTYSQEFVVHSKSENLNNMLQVNNKSFKRTSSPQTIVMENLKADGNGINIIANLTNSQDDSCWGQSFYKAYNVTSAPESCMNETNSTVSRRAQ